MKPKYSQKFYDVWREGSLVCQTATPGTDCHLLIGDILVEYQLNRVLTFQEFTKLKDEIEMKMAAIGHDLKGNQ